VGAQSRIAHPPHQSESTDRLVVSALVDRGRSWLVGRLLGARCLHTCFVTLVLGGGVFHTTTSGLLGVHLRLLLVGGAGGGDLGLVCRVDVVLLVAGLWSEAVLRALRVAVSLALRGVRRAVLLAAWRGDVGLAFLRCKQLGTLVSDVGAKRDDLSALSLLHDGEDECGELLLFVLDSNICERVDREAVIDQVVVHVALASFDPGHLEALNKRVDQICIGLAGDILIDRVLDLLLRGVLDELQRVDLFCVSLDFADVGERLQTRVELAQINACFIHQLIPYLSGHKGQIGTSQKHILAE